MILPDELKLNLPVTIANDVVTTTMKVWEILVASRDGRLEVVKQMVTECPAMAYAQYNYTPPIHLAVREGHIALVEYLLFKCGAHDPDYKTYPFLDSLDILAEDRGFTEIVDMLKRYRRDPGLQKFSGDNGKIHFNRTEQQNEFQKTVDQNEIGRVKEILEENPDWARDNTFFWGEGILCMPAKGNHREMILLLMSHGASVPNVLKWAPAYYFERYDSAEFLMEHGMDPNTMDWHGVTLLHNAAQKGWADRAKLLIDHGADIDAIDEEYQSTPLGIAARWGQAEIVEMLLKAGADPARSGAPWSTPLTWAKKKGHSQISKMLDRRS
jgi:ankyrin repeat protein